MGLAVGITGLALAAWAFAIEPASLRNEDHSIALATWPTACSDTRVAVLADLHTGSPWNGLDKLERIVATTQAVRPDLILLAGDYVIHGVLAGTSIPPALIDRCRPAPSCGSSWCGPGRLPPFDPSANRLPTLLLSWGALERV